MAKIIRAMVNPQALAWAREQAGISVDSVATKLKVKAAQIASWESGELRPTIRQLRLLGKMYKRPSAFFYLTELPQPDPGMPDYRRADRAEAENPPELQYEIRNARARRAIALDVLEQLGEAPPRFELELDPGDSPEALGRSIRSYMGITTETQFGWTNPYQALSSWIAALESKGALAFQFSGIDVHVARGFSIHDRPLPAIALNGKDAARARIFTLLHEVCHVAIFASGLCDLHEEPDEFSGLEVLCNAAAAETLVPGEILLNQPEARFNPEAPKWSGGRLRALSNRFMVSREVILRRLLTLNRTTQQFYSEKRADFLDEYEMLSAQGGGFIEYYRKVLRNNGPAFTSLVIDAYRENAISAMDVSRYLGGLRLNHLQRIENELSQ